ncbi:MAG: hypothetical protein ACYDHP_00610 [Ferrimicrobium sp.]
MPIYHNSTANWLWIPDLERSLAPGESANTGETPIPLPQPPTEPANTPTRAEVPASSSISQSNLEEVSHD